MKASPKRRKGPESFQRRDLNRWRPGIPEASAVPRWRSLSTAPMKNQKVPTPITPIRIDKEHRHITLAYFDQKSTVDYIGAVQGIPVCFDAKECDSDTFPLQNIHEHQVRFMEDFERQEGVAFLILFFSHRNELYYLSYQRMREFWDRAAAGGRKSFRHEELSPDFVLNPHGGYLVPYLDGIQKIMDGKEEGL